MANKKDYTITTVSSSAGQHGVAQAPFSLSPFSSHFRDMGMPYIAGPTTAIDMGLEIPPDRIPRLPNIEATSVVYSPTIDLTVPLPLIAASSVVYSPIVSAVADLTTYTEIVSASNPNNSSSMHVGSIYLDARTYATFGVLVSELVGGIQGGTHKVHTELKKFTDGSLLLALSSTVTVPKFIEITSSNVIVSTSDWYDIYISASGNPATSSIKGFYYDY